MRFFMKQCVQAWNLDQNGGNSKPCLQRLHFVIFLLQGKKIGIFG